jgi:ribose 5-phosphate isomerase
MIADAQWGRPSPTQWHWKLHLNIAGVVQVGLFNGHVRAWSSGGAEGVETIINQGRLN